MIIEMLYPEICNLYGDFQNAEYLARSCEDIEIVRTSLDDTPRFVTEKVDLITMCGTTERRQELVIEKLMPYKEKIKELIDGGTMFLWTGNAMEVLFNYIERDDSSKIPGLGILDFHAKRRMLSRHNSLYLGKLGDMDIVGFNSRFTHAYGNNSDCYLFDTVRGVGINPETDKAGIRVNNFMGTYIIGPLLILNPPFAKYILEELGVKEPKLAFEKTAMEVYDRRVSEFKNPRVELQ
jgi:CobQ-like glutamine amidotransferase family enzyme